MNKCQGNLVILVRDIKKFLAVYQYQAGPSETAKVGDCGLVSGYRAQLVGHGVCRNIELIISVNPAIANNRKRRIC